MIIGIPREIKNHEYRVGMTPSSVREVTLRGHRVMVESTAGAGIGYSDELYRQAGAEVVADAATLFASAELIVKVKEPQAAECARLRPGQILFTYLHLAPDLAQTQALLASGATCIAYETVTQREGGLPLLAPMSAVAGRMSIQAGAQALEKTQGGRGILLGGVPGVDPAKVVILGGGVVGANAARMALGMRADVTLLDCNLTVLQRLDSEFQGRVKLVYSSREAIGRLLPTTDLLIGGVLVPGAAAPKLVSRAQVATMRPGSAIVDVAIDQGGCVETSHPTTHQAPTYVEEGVVHYCVANMPGAVAYTATQALNNATLPYILALADHGLAALRQDAGLLAGLNVMAGQLTCQAVARAHGLSYTDPHRLLA
ncbi:alanine dehydrogenase [Edwardsiella tarda]|uniref:alanine dehydrogenase n=2 Tax=Edwardsiella tarda TaxID=636 RepID=UPI00351BFAA1